jgi:hypothetical protein
MIVTRIQLHCSWIDCRNHFPEDGALDGAIFTSTMVRKEARAHGWTRTEQMDLCPSCSAKLNRAAKGLLDKYKEQQKAGHL